MESGCYCGVRDVRECRCLPAYRGERGDRYVSRGGGRDGSTRGGRDGSTRGGRDGSTRGGRDGSTRGGRDGSTRGGRYGSTRGGRDGSTRGGRDGSTRGGRDGNDRGDSWTSDYGRGYSGLGRRGARFFGYGARNRGGYRYFGSQQYVGNEGYYESGPLAYYDESYAGYYPTDLDIHGYGFDGCYYDGGHHEFHDYGDSGGGREALRSSTAGRRKFSARGNRNPKERGTRYRGSDARCHDGRTRTGSGSVERRGSDSVSVDRSDEDHDSDANSRQRSSRKNKKSSTNKTGDESKSRAVERIKAPKKVPRNCSDDLNIKGHSRISHSDRKSRSKKKNRRISRLKESSSRNHSSNKSSSDSGRSRNSFTSTVNSKKSKGIKGKSTRCSSSSGSSSSGSNNGNSSESSSKSDSSERSNDTDTSNSGSRNSSASSGCKSANKNQSKRKTCKHNYRVKGHKSCAKCRNNQKTSKDDVAKYKSKKVVDKSKNEGASKSLDTTKEKSEKNLKSHDEESSSTKSNEILSSGKNRGSSEKSNEIKAKHDRKARGEHQTYGNSSLMAGEEASSSKNLQEVPGKISKIKDSFVIEGAEPLILTEDEYAFILGCGTLTPQTESVVNSTQTVQSSSNLATSKIMIHTAKVTSQKTGASPSSVIRYEWQFQDEYGAWITYGQPSPNGSPPSATTVTSDDIENHFNKDPETQLLEIECNSFRYVLDLKTMTQTNKQTSRQRRIRRVNKSGNPSSNPDKAVDSDRPVNVRYEWQFQDEHQTWIRYGNPNSQNDLSCVSSTSSDDIEKHYQQDPTKTFYIQSQHHQYLVKFSKMTQTNVKTKAVRRIRRVKKLTSAAASDTQTSRDSSFESMPSTWSPMPSSKPWTKVRLRSSDPEYIRQVGAILHVRPDYKIVNMYRVQNKFLWKAYANKKDYLKEQFPRIKYREEFLYHGTDPANVKAICKENVDWRLHGTNNGNVYGRGSYFSNCAQLSSQYSTAQGTGMAAFGSSWTSQATAFNHQLGQSYYHPLGTGSGWYRSSGVNAVGANAYGANTYGANTYGANTYGANAYGANTYGANTYGANTHGANAYGTNYYGSIAVGANAYGTNAYGANAYDQSPNERDYDQSSDEYDYDRARNRQKGGLGNIYQPPPSKAMFIVRVLVGNITQGSSSTVRPPKDGSGQPCDTTVDSVFNPTIFVKYDTQEYYPEYYIEFD